MSPVLRAVDTVLSQDVVVIGRVVDAVSGRPLRSDPTLSLVHRATPELTVPLALRVTPDGLFAFFGDRHTALPELTGAQTLELLLVASAPGYRTTSVDVTLDAADVALTRETRRLGGRTVELEVRTGPPVRADLALRPLPVHLAGRVVRRDDPSVPIAEAEIRVTGPQAHGPTTTDVNGFYLLQDLPTEAEATVRVAAIGFTTLVETVVLDYAVTLNRRSFALAV